MGDLKLAIFLAYKTIFKGNRWALVLIVTVMSLSFANLLLTPSILLGVTDTINRQQVETVYGDIVVDPPSDDYYLNGANEIAEAVSQVPGVVGVAPRLTGSALIEYEWREKDTVLDKGTSGTWSVVGIDPVSEADVTTISQNIVEGSYLDASDRDALLLGIEIAGGEKAETAAFQTLQGATVGDRVRLTYANGVQREYTVKGIFYARESRADRTAFVTRAEMASVLGRTVYSDRASQILVNVGDSAAGNEVIEAIRALGIAGEVRSWRDYSGAMAGVVSSFDMVAGLITGIGLVVAGIVMFIVVYINVIHSRRHIGILRAIGIKRDVIISSYLMQALFYAVMGIVLGGMAFGFGVQTYFDHHPLDLSMGLVTLALQPDIIRDAVIGLIAAAALAGLVPVLSITRQGIIHAIWGN
jgi:putative ABC transport system permease protein